MKKNRVLFLGERAIAWRLLTEFLERQNVQMTELVAIVTNPQFYRDLVDRYDCVDLGFVSNDSRRENEILDLIQATSANLLVSVQHNWILSEKILQAVDGFSLNLHNARLPAYKGYNSIGHAILNGDDTYQSTLHWMTEKVDSGDFAYVEEVRIDPCDTAKSLYEKTIHSCAKIGKKLFDTLDRGDVPPRTPMPPGPGVFYGKGTIKELLDVTRVEDPERRARIARAAYYPPHNNAYLQYESLRINLIPETVTHEKK